MSDFFVDDWESIGDNDDEVLESGLENPEICESCE